jgi:hypothetical protein
MRPIAAALVALFGLTSLDAVCAPLITNCADSGAGSLRQAVHDAAENDTLDLTNLPCSEISLMTGAIPVAKNNLRIEGPGADRLKIDRGASPGTNLISHYSTTGTLKIDHMTLSGGDFYMSSTGKYFGGGCVGSFGNLELDYVTLTFCNERTGYGAAGRGGAAFANGNLTMTHSIVTQNKLIGPQSSYYYCYDDYYCYYFRQKNRPQQGAASMRGAGLFAKGTLTIDHTTISGNGGAYYGGGVYAAGPATISYSTFSSNAAFTGAAVASAGTGVVGIRSSTFSGDGGGNGFSGTSSTIEGRKPPTGTPQPIRLYNSTVANNGGIFVINSAIPLGIYNSTIAFNHSDYEYASDTVAAVSISNAELHVMSSIIADNLSDDVQLSGTATITGSNNLINYPSGILAGTLSACPQLLMLNANGGPTKTLALRGTSPAVGTGSNPKGFTFDQRGTGFLRQFQTATDIGAFEWNGSDDDIFSGRFDGSGLRCDM